MKEKIYLITGNEGKAREYREILGERIEREALELEEIQELDSEKVIKHKLEQAYGILHYPVIIDDVSLTFNAIAPLPGTLIKWFLQSLQPDGLAHLLDQYPDRSAINTTTIGYNDGSQIHMFEGVLKGTIASHPRGENGFGWDCLFIPENTEKTLAELSAEEKNTLSSRRLAIAQLLAFLG